MKNIRLHLQKADYHMRRVLAGLPEGSPLIKDAGHVIASLRKVREALPRETQEHLQRDLDVPLGSGG